MTFQKLIEHTIQYNRLWQREIVRYPRIYQDLTALNEAVLTRQVYLDAPPLGEECIEADLLDRAASSRAASRKQSASSPPRISSASAIHCLTAGS